MRPTRPSARANFIMRSRSCTREVPDGDEVVIVFGREPDHVVELQVLDPAREDHLGAVEDLGVGHRLVDDAAKAIRPRLRRDGDGPLAALVQPPDDGLGEIVHAERCRADAVAHGDQSLEDVLDGGVIAQRDRHQPHTAGMRAGGLGDGQDPIGIEGAHRQVVVARPAEPAQVRASPHHLDEQPRPELGVRA